MSDNAVRASRFPPDLTVFGLLCRSPPLDIGTVCKKKKKAKHKHKKIKIENPRESLKTVPPSYPSGPSFTVQGGQGAKPWVLKSGGWWGRARG